MRNRQGLRHLGTAVLGSVVIATVLTGCSKAADGAVAIGHDADGELFVQIVTCEYPAIELDLLLEQEGADPYEDLSGAQLDQPAGTSQAYTLAELFGNENGSLDPAAPYHLRGTVADDDGERDMNGVSFTVAEVAGYEPGQMISNDLDAPVAAEAFAAQACEDGATGSPKPS